MKKLLLVVILLFSTLSFSQNYSFEKKVIIKTNNVTERSLIISYLLTNNFKLGYGEFKNDEFFDVKTINEIPSNYTKDSLLINSPYKYSRTVLTPSTRFIIEVDMEKKLVNLWNEFDSENNEKIVDFDEGFREIKDLKGKIIIPKLADYLYSIDRFTGEKTYHCNIGGTISITKVGTSHYVGLSVEGATLNYGCYGVSILFENGKKIIRPNEKVETGYRNGWTYSVFFTPTTNEINLFKTSRIVYVKLYIYDSDISTFEADGFLIGARTILTVTTKNKKK